MTRAKINFALDSIIGLAFVLAALSGIVLLFSPSGYQGGRNAAYGATTLLLNHTQWSALHTYTSLVMIAGVTLHLVLHWRWIACMIQSSFVVARQPVARTPCVAPETVPSCDPVA